jgi:hypothetical protein
MNGKFIAATVAFRDEKAANQPAYHAQAILSVDSQYRMVVANPYDSTRHVTMPK